MSFVRFLIKFLSQNPLKPLKSGLKNGDKKTATPLEVVLAIRNTHLTKITKRNVVWHQDHITWTANVHMEMVGMVDMLKLMEFNIARTLHMAIRSQSSLPGVN